MGDAGFASFAPKDRRLPRGIRSPESRVGVSVSSRKHSPAAPGSCSVAGVTGPGGLGSGPAVKDLEGPLSPARVGSLVEAPRLEDADLLWGRPPTEGGGTEGCRRERMGLAGVGASVWGKEARVFCLDEAVGGGRVG